MEELSLQLTNFFNMLLLKYGAWALGISMFAESVGIPFTSAFFIAMAWTLLEKGKLSIWEIVGIATLGISLGSSLSYAAGYYSKKIGKAIWLHFHRQHQLTLEYQLPSFNQDKANRFYKINNYIKKYGLLSVLLAQIFGFTRTFISFPAGLLEINFWYFVAFTAVGGAIFSFMAVLGSMIITKFMSYLVSYSFVLFLIVIAAASFGIIFYFKISGGFKDETAANQTISQGPEEKGESLETSSLKQK